MTDMSKILAQYKALMKPEGAGGDSPMRRDKVVKRVAPDSHALLAGTWFMGGHHNVGDAVRKMWEAAKLMWPVGSVSAHSPHLIRSSPMPASWNPGQGQPGAYALNPAPDCHMQGHAIARVTHPALVEVGLRHGGDDPVLDRRRHNVAGTV